MNVAEIIISLLGGLALFLYGMQMMSTGLEAAAGNKMKEILEKLTANRFLGVLVGAVITAVIQSSSATTVMVVGFVNSGMMTLRQAVWIIMGANIGTTITGQLIALDIGAIAPIIAFAGVAMIVFVKNQKIHHYGSILAGLGVLFIGMNMMSTAMSPLQELDSFTNLMTKFSNPLLGILVGAGFTAIIQSSSASVGILQALAMSGVIGLDSAVYVLFGQNIGTCITAVLASIGTSRNAKRTTIIHLTFNIIGTVIFTTVCIFFPLPNLIERITPSNASAQIANMHTLFNIVTTLLLIPFGNMLATFAEKIMPDKGNEQEDEVMHMEFIKVGYEGRIGISAIGIEQTQREIERMMTMAKRNVYDAYTAFLNRDASVYPKVVETEEYIDYLNKEISKYITNVITHEANAGEIFNSYFRITGNIERIGDHAMNICGYSRRLSDNNIKFSPVEEKEILNAREVSDEIIDILLNNTIDPVEQLTKISALEQKIDDMTQDYRDNMLGRMRKSECSEEGCVIYSEMLTDFERIGDHALNISQQQLNIAKDHIGG